MEDEIIQSLERLYFAVRQLQVKADDHDQLRSDYDKIKLFIDSLNTKSTNGVLPRH